MKRDRRLNPCDCMFHAFDTLMRARGYASGAGTFIMMDAVGRLAPDDVHTALQRTMETHPTTACAIAISRLRAWPVWRPADAPARPDYTYDDLSGETDWSAAADQLCQERFSAGVDPTRPPIVYLEHYRGPQNHHRLCLRWPHALMDAEGAQLFLSEMERLTVKSPAPLPPRVLPDGTPCDPLVKYGLAQRIRFALQALREREARSGVQDVALCDGLPDRPVGARRALYLMRAWTPAMVARMQANARRTAPAGPALYGRYIAGCLLRAIHRLHSEHGRALPYYGVLLPVRVRGVEHRTVAGNFPVAATLGVLPDQVEDRRGVAEEIDRQMRAFYQNRSDLASRSMQWALAQVRHSQYCWLIDYETRRQPFATGYAFLGEIDPPLRRFLGAEVKNLWACALMSIPPGWNLTVMKFRERVSFSLAWAEGAYPRNVVERYADLIEEEVFQN